MARYGCTITVDTGQMPSSQSNFAWLATEDNFPPEALVSVGTAIDSVGGNNGNLVGGVTYSSSGTVFDGLDGHCLVPTISLAVGETLSITAKGGVDTSYRLIGEQSLFNNFIELSPSQFTVRINSVNTNLTSGYTQPAQGVEFTVELIRGATDYTVKLDTVTIGTISSSDTFSVDVFARIVSFYSDVTIVSASIGGARGYDFTNIAPPILNGGGNLRCYTDSTKATQLPIEVVSFVTGGTPSVQVRGLSPTLNVASTVYIEADTVATTQPAVTDTYGRNAVWSDFEVVIHQGTVTDSTGNHTPVLNGSPSLVDMMWGGQGYSITSSSEFISIPDAASLDIEKNYYINTWVKYGVSTSTGVNPIVSKSNTANSDGFWYFVISDDLRTRHPDLSAANLDINSNLIDNTIYRLGSDFNGTTRKTIVDSSYSSDTPSGTVTTTSEDMLIGKSNSSADNHLGGVLGDVVIKKSSITDDKRNSEHNNQNSPSTFWTTGPWEDQDAGGGFQAAWAKNANKLLNWYN
jgi:hypothetical protein